MPRVTPCSLEIRRRSSSHSTHPDVCTMKRSVHQYSSRWKINSICSSVEKDEVESIVIIIVDMWAMQNVWATKNMRAIQDITDTGWTCRTSQTQRGLTEMHFWPSEDHAWALRGIRHIHTAPFMLSPASLPLSLSLSLFTCLSTVDVLHDNRSQHRSEFNHAHIRHALYKLSIFLSIWISMERELF